MGASCSPVHDVTVTSAALRPEAVSLEGEQAANARRMGRYLFIEELGRGGNGTVMRAYDLRLQREVALEAVRADLLSSDAHAEMLAEARSMARLSYPNVVAVYDAHEVADEVVVVME